MRREDESHQHDTRCFSVKIDPMDVILNGEPATLPGPLTVAGLLAHLEIDARRVAVEVNETVVKKALYDQTPVNAGDAVEIVSPRPGG